MLRKARYRCVLIIALMVSAHLMMRNLSQSGSKIWMSHRMSFGVYVFSVKSEVFRVIEAEEGSTSDGLLIAEIHARAVESPVYFHEEFSLIPSQFGRMEIGREVVLKHEFTLRTEANGISIDVKELQSSKVLRDAILASAHQDDLTVAMDQVIRSSPSLTGKVLNGQKTSLAIVANATWVIGVAWLVIEGILAYLRSRRYEAQKHHTLCFSCSYQLTRDMYQCPECGTHINWRAYPLAQVSFPAPAAQSQPSPQTHQ